MLEHLQDRNEASYLVTELATQIIVGESEVTSKLQYIRRTIAYAKDAVVMEDAENLRRLMRSPDTSRYFTGTTIRLDDGSYFNVSAKNTEKQLASVISYVAGSGLVFAHSFLEFAIETLLRITRLCEADAWLPLIATKTIAISALEENGLAAAVQGRLNDYVATLEREGLTDKVKILAKILKVSIRTSSVINYSYDPNLLSKIDLLRHQVAHHRKTDYTIDQAETDIVYLYRTCLHFLGLVVRKYDLHGANRPK